MTTPGILLGLGLGGFVDGILLHQIFQWHNMLSSTDRWARTTLEGMESNMLADGLFHLATWALVAAGVWALWSGMRHHEYASGKPFSAGHWPDGASSTWSKASSTTRSSVSTTFATNDSEPLSLSADHPSACDS
jgi:uncharacterized membrane protein